MIVSNFITAFLITSIIECLIAFLAGYRGKRFFLTVVLINLITNPALNYILLVLYSFNFLNLLPAVLVLEIIVVIVEWRILTYAFGEKRKFILLAVLMNAASYLTGLLIY